MKNVTPLIIDNNLLYDETIRRKHQPTKDLLESIGDYIKEDYDVYEANKFDLFPMIPDTRVSFLKDDLQECYKSSKRISEVKQLIEDNIPDNMKGRCLYCMFGDAETKDHYLDKDEFPEFSFYTDNLIPCCFKCNNKKSTLWKAGGRRLFINNYFDVLIDDTYLFIDIELDTVPKVKTVRLDFSGVHATVDQINLVRSHYEKLDLIDRYKKQATRFLSNIVNELTMPSKKLKADCVDALNRKILSLEYDNGTNHWETAVCRGVIANPLVMDWLSLP